MRIIPRRNNPTGMRMGVEPVHEPARSPVQPRDTHVSVTHPEQGAFISQLESLQVDADLALKVREAMNRYVDAAAWLHQFKKYPEFFPSANRRKFEQMWLREKRRAQQDMDALTRQLPESVKTLLRDTEKLMQGAVVSRMNPEESEAVDEPVEDEIKTEADKTNKGWLSAVGTRNWVILGVVLVGGYWLYRKYWKKISSSPALSVAPARRQIAAPGGRQAVTANKVASISTGNFITARRDGYDYAKILITRTDKGRTTYEFVPTTSGYYTGNLYKDKVYTWAEIQAR